jgi:glycine/sarcosine N-methyltransferase
MSGLQFYSMLSRYYDDLFPATSAEVTFISEQLRKVSARRILDVGCGTGAHCRALSELGFHALGIDIDEDMIAIAVSKAYQTAARPERPAARASEAAADASPAAAQAGTRTQEAADEAQGDRTGSASFLVAGFDDIAHLPSIGVQLGFDSILCIGNTLAHLDGIDAIETALNQMRAALRQPTADRPKAAMVLQVVNFERVMELRSVRLPDIELPDIAFFRTYSLLPTGKVEFVGRLESREAGSASASHSSSVLLTPVTARDLTEALRSLGADEIEVYGSFRRDPFDRLQSMQVVLVATFGATSD